jgi:hypothetical protein
MMIRVNDVAREWLGWCPHVRTLTRPLALLDDETAMNVPSSGTGIPERTVSPDKYRNQVLLLAVSFSLVSIPFVAYILTTDLTRLLFFIGIITGLVALLFFWRWIRNSLEMLEKGMIIKTRPGEYILLSLIAGAIPLSVLLFIAGVTGILQFAGVWAFPAFVTGFIYIPWYVLALILLWERRTRCMLVYDNDAGLFSAVRCHEHVQE